MEMLVIGFLALFLIESLTNVFLMWFLVKTLDSKDELIALIQTILESLISGGVSNDGDKQMGFRA